MSLPTPISRFSEERGVVLGREARALRQDFSLVSYVSIADVGLIEFPPHRPDEIAVVIAEWSRQFVRIGKIPQIVANAGLVSHAVWIVLNEKTNRRVPDIGGNAHAGGKSVATVREHLVDEVACWTIGLLQVDAGLFLVAGGAGRDDVW